MTQIDGEIYHVHGSEESIWWKCVYYPKQSIDSMQSLSSYQWYFSEKNSYGEGNSMIKAEKYLGPESNPRMFPSYVSGESSWNNWTDLFYKSI